MSRTLSEITMDNIGTVRETAHALAMLSAVPDECDDETQVRNKRLYFVLIVRTP